MTDHWLYNMELQKLENEQYAVVIHLDQSAAEFASELGTIPDTRDNIISTVKEIAKAKYPNLQISVLLIMVSGMVITSIPLGLPGGKTPAPSVPLDQRDNKTAEQRFSIPKSVHEPIPFNPNDSRER